MTICGVLGEVDNDESRIFPIGISVDIQLYVVAPNDTSYGTVPRR